MSLSESEKKVFLDLLEKASEQMSNKICCDYILSKLMPDKDERVSLMREMHEENGDPELWDPNKEYAGVPHDWWLLSFLGKKALKA